MDENKPEPLDKKKVENIKLLLSSLFARSQKYMVVDGNNKGTLIFSNFPYERVILYKSEAEDTMCTVTLKTDITELLYEAFPIFGTIVAEIQMQHFLAALNKCLALDKTKWPEIVVDKEKDRLLMSYAKEGEAGTADIGRLLPPDAPKYYTTIVEQFNKFTPTFEDLIFSIPDGHWNDPVIMEDFPVKDPRLDYSGPEPQPLIEIRCPIRDGNSIVSFKEYLKKRNLPIRYTARVQYKPDTKTAKIAFGYNDDWLDCWSIMPGSLLFPF